MRLAALTWTALCAAVLGGCGSSGGASDKELEGLVVATAKAPPTVDVARAGRDAATLAAALRLPWSRAAAQLGDHRLTIHTTMELREGTTVLETLGDSTVLDLAKDGTYHATYENSADYGREIVFQGGALFLRPRYARWHQRAPETATEPAELRDQLAGALGAHVELYAHGLEVSDKGSVQEAGRAAHRLELKLAPSPKAAPKATVTQRAWRDGATVEAAAGEVFLDDATGLALRAKVDATVGFVRDGKRLTMRVTLDQSLTPGAVTITPPEAAQVVATPERAREVDERNALLQGIAPAVGKAGTPSAGTAPAAGKGSAATPDSAPAVDKGSTAKP